jgi:hypothetical protein
MSERVPVRILTGFWAGAVAITLLGELSIKRLQLARPIYSGEWRFHPHLLDIWTRWDGGWYQKIATDGYFYDPHRQSSIVFWPTYPLTLRPFVALGMNPYLAGFIVTLAATTAAIVLFLRWQRDFHYVEERLRPDQVAVSLGVVAWLLYPYAYYLYGSLYSDAMFAAVTIGSFWLLERDKPVAAGLLGIAATAGRPFGWAVTVGLALRVLERRWREQHEGRLTIPTLVKHPVSVVRCLKPLDFGVGLSGIGVLSYLTYLWVRFGSPLVFATNEEQWGEGVSRNILIKREFWLAMVHQWSPSPVVALTLIAQVVVGLSVLAAVVPVRRRFGLGLATYQLLTILPPLIFSKDFLGIGRYALAAFPFFALLGYHLRPRLALARVGLVASGLIMVVLSSLFARGFYLS